MTDTRAPSITDRINPEEVPPYLSRKRQIFWGSVLGWTVFVGFALWWLLKGNSGPSVWVFQERDLNQPGFTEKIQAIFRSDLGLQRAYPWVLFGPYLALMAWYFPLERERLFRNLPLNVTACLTFVWACHAIDLRTTTMRARFVMVGSDPGPPGTEPSKPKELIPPRGRQGRFAGSDEPIPLSGPPGNLEHRLPRSPSRKVPLRSTILDLLAYGAVTGLIHSVNFYQRLRERERRALFLESTLARARLNTLQAQLQPHFLFNSLNAIAALLRRDPLLAETTLVALSELLRLALSQSERQEESLREELEFVRRYLEIQQIRFGDKLRIEQDIEPHTLDCLVPTLVLQLLVENAIQHGIEPSEKAGLVRVSASRQDGKLLLAVEDDGVGLTGDHADSGGVEIPADLYPNSSAPSSSPSTNDPYVIRASAGTGIGLANLRERLQALYGSRQKLELIPRAARGVVVRVEIPWHVRENQ